MPSGSELSVSVVSAFVVSASVVSAVVLSPLLSVGCAHAVKQISSNAALKRSITVFFIWSPWFKLQYVLFYSCMKGYNVCIMHIENRE